MSGEHCCWDLHGCGGCSIALSVNVCELLNKVVKGLLSSIGLWEQFVDSDCSMCKVNSALSVLIDNGQTVSDESLLGSESSDEPFSARIGSVMEHARRDVWNKEKAKNATCQTLVRSHSEVGSESAERSCGISKVWSYLVRSHSKAGSEWLLSGFLSKLHSLKWAP